ncbi:purine nucleoside phosphorylase YfiH [Proteus columbae]|uniref:purine nucleoside phosphorylase YfiH n=1 Tax=Proteus columbae TaxID=1987580 RepID=UPI0018C728E5|nr:purine nucleoside phosphorylase YfiH [Proteus columbae]MBG6028655.1 polyphenol oxidase [Proteus mirabilis]MBG6048803.1 polyphenol oxidase [Proteus mirabilis]
MTSLIFPDWPQPENIGSCSTLREGGISLPPYDSFNLGTHVGDKLSDVEENRRRLCQQALLPEMPLWLEQVHGTHVVTLNSEKNNETQGDALYTSTVKKVCAIMTADCLPVLFTTVDGTEVGAAHGGWRGLCHGVLQNTLAQFKAPKDQIMAWLGPAIGPTAFEVGAEVRLAFIEKNIAFESAFIPHNGKYLANIYMLARIILQESGITQIYGGDFCTVTDPSRFFSYRRERVTGRMASLIWIK